MQDRVIGGQFQLDDAPLESLRPQCLDDYIGQSDVKENFRIFIQAAKMREEALDHVLLYGPPGLGKTTLAMIIANELGVRLKITSGPAIERPGDLAAILTTLEAGDVLFIDEIHRLNRSIEEILYPAMEDYVLDIMVGKGPSARSVRIDLPPFTLVGATTRAGSLSAPLRDRFGVVSHLNYYCIEDLQKIIGRAANILRVKINTEGSYAIASRSRGTPRVATRLLKRVRDFAQVNGDELIDSRVAATSLTSIGIDEKGLDEVDHKLLRAIIELFDGGPVGVDTIAATIGEESETIEDVYEPYLLQMGFLQRTPRGRIVSEAVYKHFNIPFERR